MNLPRSPFHSSSGERSAPGVTAGICPPYPNPPGAPTVLYGGRDPAAAGSIAAAAGIAIVVVGTTSSEGADRTSLALDEPYDALVAAVLAAQPRTVVAVRCPGACLMPWLREAPAVIFQGLAGQEAGGALADVLFGAANPAGR